jgi:hypothetical protein
MNFGSLHSFLRIKTINKRHTVSGLKSADGLRRVGENGPLARHGGLLRTGEIGPTRPGGRPAARVPHAERGHRATRVPGAVRWRVSRGLASGRGTARCSALSPPLRGGSGGQSD